MRYTKEQISSFVEEISINTIDGMFWNAHVFQKHHGRTREDLIKEALHKRVNPAILQAASSFDTDKVGDRKNLEKILIKCLRNPKTIEAIIDWQEKNPAKPMVLKFRFSHPIGSGIVIGTDWNKYMFSFSDLHIVLKTSSKNNFIFDFVTAFPFPNREEREACLLAKREWQ